MNPYEKTAEEMKRQSQGPQKFAKAVIGTGAALGASAFAPMLARAAPFLSQYIPTDLAIKGLSKISPKFGKFIKDAIDSGYDFEEVKDFVGDQVNQSQTEQAKENRNIIEQYSPELHQFIENAIKLGESGLQAGAKAKATKKFDHVIKEIEKDHKLDWLTILENIYGNNVVDLRNQKKDLSAQSGATQQQNGVDPQLAQIIGGIRDSMNRLRGGQ